MVIKLSLGVDPAKVSGPGLHELTWINPKKSKNNI
jgi:hypothetical protein